VIPDVAGSIPVSHPIPFIQFSEMTCPLCEGNTGIGVAGPLSREYIRCGCCNLVYVTESGLICPEAERAHYLLHNNHPHDPGYRNFLARLADPLCEHLHSPSSGLDFGCGPGPTLSLLMAERGHHVVNYDPLFFPEPDWHRACYDFVASTEVFEHLRCPLDTLVQIWSCLRPGGWLAVMTGFTDRVIDFQRWHYPRDPTHIRFWSRQTFAWLASRLAANRLEFPASDLAFLQK
jgi:SAM-dependent methyltransferase